MASAPFPNSKLVLEPNVPELIALRYPTPKIVSSSYSEEKQAYYSLVDGRSAYLSLAVAQSIENLQLGTKEPFWICKRWNGSKQQMPRYDVWLTPEGEKARAGQEVDPPAVIAEDPPSDLERQVAASLAAIQARKRGEHLMSQRPPAASPAPAPPPPQPRPLPLPRTNPLAEEAALLVDAFAAVLEYSLTTYQGRVKPDDVRSLLLTVYIGRQKNGGPR